MNIINDDANNEVSGGETTCSEKPRKPHIRFRTIDEQYATKDDRNFFTTLEEFHRPRD